MSEDEALRISTVDEELDAIRTALSAFQTLDPWSGWRALRWLTARLESDWHDTREIHSD